MSAYASLASLPGSFLPPFFAFGTPPSPEEEDSKPKTDGVDIKNITQPKDTPCSSSPCTNRSRKEISPSAFQALALTTSETDGSSDLPPASPPPSQPSDIIIAIRSARVDPVELIKSLTSKGSSIARRTANFIARTPDAEEDNNAEKQGSDEVSVFSGPGICYEDSDSDDEYSMYDYSDDFSTPSNDDENDESNYEDEKSSSDGDPSAIEFDLSITFQGRKYNATRAFPAFAKLREELLDELSKNDRRSKRSMGGSRSPCNIDNEFMSTTIQKGNVRSMQENVSVPELPRVSPDDLGHGGYALSGVARSGFALLQATAQHYCPEMECWMMQVIESFPCSQSLSSFLWEPLSSSNASWETIGEEKEFNSCSDVGRQEKISPLTDSSTLTKPPLHTRSKPKAKALSKGSRYKKSHGSMTSLNSIEEGDGNDCENDDW